MAIAQVMVEALKYLHKIQKCKYFFSVLNSRVPLLCQNHGLISQIDFITID